MGWKQISSGISGGKQTIKFAIARNRGPLCLFSQNKTTIQSRKMCGLSFGKINVIIACYDDIFVRYSIKKSNDHFHP